MILSCYSHSIYIFCIIYSYKDEILEVSLNLQVQESKFDGKIYKFGGKYFKQLNSAEFMEFVCFLGGGQARVFL